jgi:NADH-quinone oxidoreductase subunit M
MKKLVAYSSVSHLGFCVLGIFSFTAIGMNGAVYQMLNHGVSTGGLFMLLGMIYERRHNYEIKQYGGLATTMPVFATFFMVIMLASAGLPLLNGFVGEFLILSGAFQAKMLYGILAASGIIWGAYYLMWLYQRVFYGEVTNPVNSTLPDLNGRERLSLWPLVIMSLVMGVVPTIFLRQIDPAVKVALAPFANGLNASAPAAHHFTQVIAQVIGR